MRVKTTETVSAVPCHHNETVVQAGGLKLETSVKGGCLENNHNQAKEYLS
jgi:hypothetical protein